MNGRAYAALHTCWQPFKRGIQPLLQMAKLRHDPGSWGAGVMSLHHVTEVAWSKLLVAWEYPFPLGLIFLTSFLLIVAGLAMSLRNYVHSRHQTPD
jgi:hypothetical protein